jgi:hypothetical protein
MSSGFRDKLYWRRPGLLADGDPCALWHCFKNLAEPDRFKLRSGKTARYISLCGRVFIARSDGQAIVRPIAEMRCGICDGAEMTRRGWDESGPETIQPKDML